MGKSFWIPPKIILLVLSVFLSILNLGCNQDSKEIPQTQIRIKMATTTSTDNSGLLEVLLPPFEKQFNVKVNVIAVGTGKALKLGENGDVDVILVHARAAEDAFVAQGFGVNRHDVMYNDFVIVGPPKNPAGINQNDPASQAFQKIATSSNPFASRGDDSGTHKKEKQIWEQTNITPAGAWYLETGQGMGQTLTIAHEKQAYTLTDRGTYIAYKDKIDLVILCQDDQLLFNPYGIIAVNPARHPHVKYPYAMKLIGWITSPSAQKIIAEFKKDGEAMFYPNKYPR